jgi:uncharacterized protein (DUF1015 family)
MHAVQPSATQQTVGDLSEVLTGHVEAHTIDRTTARRKDARPHLRIRHTERRCERPIGARPVADHHLDSAVDVRHQATGELRHRFEGFPRDDRSLATRVGERSKHRPAAGPFSVGRRVRGIVVGSHQSRTLQEALGSDPQRVESERAMKGDDHHVDLGRRAHTTVHIVFENIVNINDVDTVLSHRLENPRSRTHEGPLSRLDQQCRGHRARDHVTLRADPEAGKFCFLFRGRRRPVVGHEHNAPTRILKTPDSPGRAFDRRMCAPDHTIEVTEDDPHRIGRFAPPLHICHPESVPRFEPFPALRYRDAANDLFTLSAPPYDVLSADDRAEYAARHPRNIVHVDVPLEEDGPGRYDKAARDLATWRAEGSLVVDDSPTFTLYRMTFTDDAGRRRSTVGVLGALEVVDEGAGGVLPHERTTPKAKTDRLDLTRATLTNLSPVWGLSLCAGLSDLLREAGEPVGSFTDENGVEHTVERVSDPARIAAIANAVGSQPVVIADGHHRYAISRTYRDETRAAGSPVAAAAGTTLTYVAELVAEQLSIAAIHRLVTDSDAERMATILATCYDRVADVTVSGATLAQMDAEGCICLVRPDGTGTLWKERPADLDAVRALDSARLEHTITHAGSSLDEAGITYQHGVTEVLEALRNGHAKCAVLIRPVSLAEIRRTADEGLLMPPKSTFFTPKLRTGLVVRPLAG